jgi:hypothetical protein
VQAEKMIKENIMKIAAGYEGTIELPMAEMKTPSLLTSS